MLLMRMGAAGAVAPETVLDHFQRAAVGGCGWEAPLGLLAELCGAHAGQIAGLDAEGGLIANVVTGLSQEQVDDYVATGGPDPRVNPRTRAVLAARPHSCVIEADFATPQTLRAHPYYAEFFARHDVPHACLVKLIDNGTHRVALTLLRSRAQGPAPAEVRELLERIAPLIERSVLQGLLVEQGRHLMMLDVLEQMARPVFVLGAQGKLVACSRSAQQLASAGTHVAVRQGRCAAAHEGSAPPFARALARTARNLPAQDRIGTTLVLRADDGGAPLVADVLPLPNGPGEPLLLASALLSIRTERAPDGRAADRVCDLFGLTRSEGAVVLHLASGLTTEAIARVRGTSHGTVRNQVKSALEKTGAGRQAELVRIVSRVV